jgi:signal transduction histidine kinase
MRDGLRGLCSPALAVALLLVGPLLTVASGETRHVLVVSSSERPFAPQSGFADALVRDLILWSREPLQFVEVSVQTARASDDTPGASTAQRIRAAFEASRQDLVITIGGPAATFAQQYRQELFAATPMLVAGVDYRFIKYDTFADNETAVSIEHEPAPMIAEILRLRPETRSIMVVVGTAPVDRFWLQQMKSEFQRFSDRVQFSWTNELSFDAIKERSRTMPAQSAIFFATLSVDAAGEPLVDGDTLKAIHAVANAPLFALHGMGDGIVGGPLVSIEDLSETTAHVALRVLAGESPGRIKTPVQHATQQAYDARELRRWNIDERLLPPASIVLFREPTFWDSNRRAILVGALLGGIPIVAFVLFVGIMKRRRAPERPANMEPVPMSPPAELSNLSQRLIQEHEREGAALARTLHDDVGQRMVALTLRLHSLQDGAHDAEVAEIRDTLSSLVGEIATASDPVYLRLELLGLVAAGRRLCEELSAQYDVSIDFQDDDVPGDLPFDVALALFRVLQEATVNAAVHSQAPEVCVSVRGTRCEVRLEVVDRGVGFDAQHAVSGAGVGLAAIRERLKLVNGDSRIVSGPGEGTRVEAWVPLALT